MQQISTEEESIHCSLLQLGSLSAVLESLLIILNPCSVYIAVLAKENPENEYYLPLTFSDATG